MAVHAVIACSLILTAAACGKAPQVAAPTPPEVTVATPTQRDVTVFQEFVGTTQARASTPATRMILFWIGSMSDGNKPLRSDKPFITWGWIDG